MTKIEEMKKEFFSKQPHNLWCSTRDNKDYLDPSIKDYSIQKDIDTGCDCTTAKEWLWFEQKAKEIEAEAYREGKNALEKESEEVGMKLDLRPKRGKAIRLKIKQVSLNNKITNGYPVII
jgi:hypothetical protein